ncbi:hypothetical protein [Nocardia fluminea]|uniref:hypothetical protein n=1 Tax=Nocardia fluminea TaxID=134984 RepID=UPI00366037AB
MTGTAKVKPPKNNAEWARNVDKRQGQAENPTSVRVGAWVLSAQPDSENLLASHVDGGSVVLAAKPASADSPDDVARTDFPYIKVERQQNQAEARGSSHLVQWDTVAYQSSDFGFTPTATDISIPVDGVYDCNFSLIFKNQSNVTNKAIFLIDGVVKMADERFWSNGAAFNNFYLSEKFSLSAGTIVSAAAFVSGSGTFDFGASAADPTVFTSLSLVRLPVG